MDWVLALVLDQLSGVPEVIGLDVQELTSQGSVLEVVGGHRLRGEMKSLGPKTSGSVRQRSDALLDERSQALLPMHALPVTGLRFTNVLSTEPRKAANSQAVAPTASRKPQPDSVLLFIREIQRVCRFARIRSVGCRCIGRSHCPALPAQPSADAHPLALALACMA